MMININKILKRLKEPPRIAHPTIFETRLREELAKEIEAHLNDPETAIKKATKLLDGKETDYAYRFRILRTYKNYFLSILPEQKFNWTFELKDHYKAAARIDGKWHYYTIYPEKDKITNQITLDF